ncbi:RICIN domain-containing protein [Streptomyces sp. NPDC059918]|uniref:RICIN domain-containing protein n=1 Tax=unclassified Streptomyces TaxID=2593676 RepID=UPI00365439E1
MGYMTELSTGKYEITNGLSAGSFLEGGTEEGTPATAGPSHGDSPTWLLTRVDSLWTLEHVESNLYLGVEQFSTEHGANAIMMSVPYQWQIIHADTDDTAFRLAAPHERVYLTPADGNNTDTRPVKMHQAQREQNNPSQTWRFTTR